MRVSNAYRDSNSNAIIFTDRNGWLRSHHAKLKAREVNSSLQQKELRIAQLESVIKDMQLKINAMQPSADYENRLADLEQTMLKMMSNDFRGAL